MENKKNYDEENLIIMNEISEKNPYVFHNEINETTLVDNQYPSLKLPSGEKLFLTEENYQNAIEIEKRLCPVKFICLLDIMLNFCYLINGYIISFIFFICSIGGYVATTNYNKNYMIGYICYQLLQIVFRCCLLILTIFLASSKKFRNDFKENMNDIDLPNNYYILITLYTFLFLIQIYIYNYILEFYKLLPNKRYLSRYSII